MYSIIFPYTLYKYTYDTSVKYTYNHSYIGVVPRYK